LASPFAEMHGKNVIFGVIQGGTGTPHAVRGRPVWDVAPDLAEFPDISLPAWGMQPRMLLLKRAGLLDQRAFDAVAAARLPGFEYVLPRLSRIADHSVLWLGIAGGLAVTKQPRLRRAALRGVFALGMASPIANVAGKQLFRRRRPIVELTGLPASAGRGTLIPSVRVRWRLPTSPSFPSGHSATAAAFTGALAMEAPKSVVIPVAVAAAGVAFSRVYTGAHYPGDVFAGLALGAVAAATTRVIWPTRPAPAPGVWSMPAEAVTGTSADGAGVVVVVNQGAGGGDVTRTLRAELPAAEIVEAEDDLGTVLREAADRATVLGVCGGDGTVNAGAEVAVQRDLPLLVIPGGTLNHFSRAIGMETVKDAVEAYRSGGVVRVDVACAGERLFLNTASFGAYTELVGLRTRMEDRIGKWPALAVAAVRVLRHSEPAEVTVEGRRLRVWFAFLGNCRYGSYGVAPTWRRHLADGVLDVRLIGARRHIGRTRAVAALLLGHLHLMPDYKAWRASGVRVEGAGGPLRFAADGELRTVDGPVEVTKRRAALAVFAPASLAGSSRRPRPRPDEEPDRRTPVGRG
jgi:diacylglycerol kinase family enzyme/membrane-associated phospholipid phosphatase